MKRISLLILFVFLFAATTSAAESFYVKGIVGFIVPSIDGKITFNKDITDGSFENFSGSSGVLAGAGITVERFEVTYFRQFYVGSNNTAGDTYQGDLKFDVETLDLGLYLFEKPLKKSFNFLVGIGKGFGAVYYEPESGSSASSSSSYVSEYHFRGAFTYEFLDWLHFNLEYMSHSMQFISGESFTNSVQALTVSARF